MSARKTLFAVLLAVLAVQAAPSGALAAPVAVPAWRVQSLAVPTNFKLGDKNGTDLYEIFVTNNGEEPTDRSPITIVDTLPAGLGVEEVELKTWRNRFLHVGPTACKTQVTGGVSTVTCTVSESLAGKEQARLYPNEDVEVTIHLTVQSPASEMLTNHVQVKGGGAVELAAESYNPLNPPEEEASAGFQEFRAELTGPDGRPTTQADGHPYQYTTGFALNINPAPPGSQVPFVPAKGDLKEIEVALPPGLVGNPTATKRCTAQQFNTTHSVTNEYVENATVNECPDGSAVGVVAAQLLEGIGEVGGVPLYNLVPPKGMPAQFGFQLAGLPIYINTRLRSGSDYGITGYLHNTTEAKRVMAAQVTFWGTPGSESHDRLRGSCAELGGPCSAEMAPRPFFRLPSSCTDPLFTMMNFDTWAEPGGLVSANASAPAPVGCALPDFGPTIEAQPSTDVADSPTGLRFDLHMPQKEQEEDPEGLGEADLRDATVTLPKGLLVNPASADGLAACSSAQIGLTTKLGEIPPHFNEEPAGCPDASKIGTVQADTPLLDHPIEGAVYLAKQGDNPFKSLLALYIALEDPRTGIVAKLAGQVQPDLVTGQLTNTFVDNPQLPVEDFKFEFFGGARASLRTPPTCGTYTTTTDLKPWTAPEGADATPSNPFPIGAGPGGPCPSGALAPKLSAGLVNPTAATYSPFGLRLTRADATGEFAGLTTTTPLGLSAKLAGVPYCPESGIAQAASRSNPGQGAAELASPSCPADSEVGTTTAGAGAGATPFYAAGRVYLAGPYKGAPLSLVAIIPAVAGPFDFGVVVNRIALHIDPETAQVTAQSDPLPTILSGIPLDARDIRVDLNRHDFILAPTNCEPQSVTAGVLGVSGATANVSDRFQIGGCSALPFKPKLSINLKGGTKRGRNPALKAVVTYPKAPYANIASASVALPHSEFLAQEHIRTICTRVQFAANACPKGSIYGKARATTPLLGAPLEGPVYLRSSSHPLPDLVAAMHGQIDVDLVGRIDSVHGGIRTTFETVPDAPVSRFVLEMQGGSKGLLVNSRSICSGVNRATVQMTGQNGKTYDTRPVLMDSCPKPKPKRHGRHR